MFEDLKFLTLMEQKKGTTYAVIPFSTFRLLGFYFRLIKTAPFESFPTSPLTKALMVKAAPVS